MNKANTNVEPPKIPKGKIFVSSPIPIKTRDVNRIANVDLEFEEIDQYGQSFEGCVFLNNPDANHDTPKTKSNGYAGSFFVFAHGGKCYGGTGHCNPKPNSNIYDLRVSHPLTPSYALVRITETLKEIAKTSDTVIVTVVPFPMSYNNMADMENLLKFKKLRLVIYDK